MKVIFDARVLIHENFTGVENYTKNILEKILTKLDINIAKPSIKNKYLAHLWTHFILPFYKGDLLFCPANISSIYVPKSKKIVLTVHDVAFLTYPESFSMFFRLYYKFIVPINIKRADKIITVSNSSKIELEKYYPYSQGKIKVISLGIDKSFKCLNLQKKKQILYVGSMNERKNFTGVIEAFKLLNFNDYKLVIVGNFSSNFAIDIKSLNLLNYAKNNSSIKFKSNIDNDELIKIYNKSKLFLFPSFYEGFGLPILESMACGTPVVTSNVTSLPEVGGNAVMYCNPYDVNDIKEKMELVLGDEVLQEKMINKGLLRAKQFTWEKSGKEHIKVFREVLNS